MKDLPQSLLIKLLDATAEGVFAFDREGHLTAWNDRMEQLSGLQGSAVIGKSYRDLFPGLIDTGEDSYFDSALAGEKSICRTSAFANHSSSRQRLDAHYSPLTNEHGHIVGGIGILHAPSSFQTSYRAADDPYQRLTKHLENSPLVVVEWDSDFRVSRWSESAEALFGWEAVEVLGKHVNEWHFVFADDVYAVDTVTFRQREGVENTGRSLQSQL